MWRFHFWKAEFGVVKSVVVGGRLWDGSICGIIEA
jgi:hypothetical protein